MANVSHTKEYTVHSCDFKRDVDGELVPDWMDDEFVFETDNLREAMAKAEYYANDTSCGFVVYQPRLEFYRAWYGDEE